MRDDNVISVTGRRINPDDGAVEYSVQWAGYDNVCDTWEPRCHLLACCAGLVGEVDAREETAALQRIASWAQRGEGWKRARDASPVSEVDPPLYGIIVHSGAEDGAKSRGSLVALGERVLADATSLDLNPTKKKRLQGQGEHDPACDPALQLEKCWREQHAVSFMHTCAVAARRTPAPMQFELGAGTDKCRDASKIKIYGIAPAALVRSGQMHDTVTSCGPPSGRSEAEHLHRQCNFDGALAHTAQTPLLGKREQLVVRYFLMKNNDGQEQTPLTMPLSVFRRYYPQLLLDFLLHHALVMESA
ncbi:hypothetical protein TraAM80_01846 [Trypanosoma rangeli]|uniref:Chromo domain-containing protein n=1 Tax=Trypanosoma rangeli TaxID=5698 RepID=A0A422NX90_TRYRA|nr:uncharacterized protein TraAM80_01846 [Trypanosoma rangeli]RNF10097.1 hypothetical protein TraAM80_01846 [Trypanosoma rangeli]|eukprot:RNF10097.1 hypothetical protein TraAM80_01846 [Trypanosoma rangeli]